MIRNSRVSIIKNRERADARSFVQQSSREDSSKRDSLMGGTRSAEVERDPGREFNKNRSFTRSISHATSITKRNLKRDVNKESMATNFKLFVAMGLTWIAEIVT